MLIPNRFKKNGFRYKFYPKNNSIVSNEKRTKRERDETVLKILWFFFASIYLFRIGKCYHETSFIFVEMVCKLSFVCVRVFVSSLYFYIQLPIGWFKCYFIHTSYFDKCYEENNVVNKPLQETYQLCRQFVFTKHLLYLFRLFFFHSFFICIFFFSILLLFRFRHGLSVSGRPMVRGVL